MNHEYNIVKLWNARYESCNGIACLVDMSSLVDNWIYHWIYQTIRGDHAVVFNYNDVEPMEAFIKYYGEYHKCTINREKLMKYMVLI